MDAKDIRNLQEAYMEVVEGREGGRFEYNQRHGRPLITPEVSQRASETETLGGGTYQRGSKRLPKNKRKYDRQVLSGVRAASEQEKQRARKRLNVGENYDLYDIILSHLLDEGYADTQEAAEAIMVNMSEEWRESIMIDEGIDMKTFKANRKKNTRKAASVDAEKRGHVGKEWYNSGRKYSPDEAKRMRSKLDDEERSTRHRSAVDPEGDDSNYSADKTKNPKKLRKQKAMGELG